MSQQSSYPMAMASDYFWTKPVSSGTKSNKVISGVFEEKCLTDSEPTAWSPTSPFDLSFFWRLGHHFRVGSSRSFWKGKRKSWESGKVGLSLVESLDDHRTDSSRIVLPSPDSRKIILKSLLRCGNLKSKKPHPLTQIFPRPLMLKNIFLAGLRRDVIERKNDAGILGLNNNPCQVIKEAPRSLNGRTESDIKMSEDYTCVTSYGTNPKTTHFYGDQVLESVGKKNELKNSCSRKKKESIFTITPLDLTTPNVLPRKDYLSFCYGCNKKLAGKDIYMYRGFKAFCSEECREEEIDKDDEMEDEEGVMKSVSSSDKKKSKKKSNNVCLNKKKKKTNGVFFTVC